MENYCWTEKNIYGREHKNKWNPTKQNRFEHQNKWNSAIDTNSFEESQTSNANENAKSLTGDAIGIVNASVTGQR